MLSAHGRIIRNLVILTLAGTGIWGCQASPRCGYSPAPEAWNHASDPYPAVAKPVADSLAAVLATNAKAPATIPRPLQVLALTGGVDGAPYSSGVLVGWSESGKRPTFDVVTGISSGALIGVYAFLGPKYDADIQRLAVTLKTDDLVTIRPARSLLLNGSFSSTKPAEQLLRTEINEDLLADLRHAHAEGRRFFVGTMALQTKRLVVWGRRHAPSHIRAVEPTRMSLSARCCWPRFPIRDSPRRSGSM